VQQNAVAQGWLTNQQFLDGLGDEDDDHDDCDGDGGDGDGDDAGAGADKA
jgi:hypothetical protein